MRLCIPFAFAFTLLVSAPAWCDEVLPSRPLVLAPTTLPDRDWVNFDIVDMRAEAQSVVTPSDAAPHSIFVIKRHVGAGIGYDNGAPHGSMGFYLTVAEWGRWNLGVASPELGFGRYSVYDAQRKQTVVKNESTLFISLASVHYRMQYLPSLGVNWYINLEQIFDVQQNTIGSQVGITLSRR